MFSMINRGRLDQATQEEFEHLFGRLRGFLSQSFDEDGQLIVADPNYAIVPVGGIVPFAGGTAPGGYLFCDGSQVSRITYKSLFDVIGTSYGVGNGTTTFTVPDLRQRFPLGKAINGTGNTLGQAGGAIDHVHGGGAHTHAFSGATDARGEHAHTVNAHSHNVSSHQHGVTLSGTTSEPSQAALAQPPPSSYAVADELHTHDVTVSGVTDHGGGGGTSAESPETTTQPNHAHNYGGTTAAASGNTDPNNPPFVVVNYLIYAGVVDPATRQRAQRRF